jgi:hypothetical protein
MRLFTLLFAGFLALPLAVGCAASGAGTGWGADPEPTPATTSSPSGGDAGSGDAGRAASDAAGATAPDAGPAPDAGTSTPPQPTDCTYPAGPYGVTQGTVLDPTLSWQGYAAGATSLSSLQPAALFDCDGSKGINAVVLDWGTIDCVNCQNEAQTLEAEMKSTWLAEGVVFTTLLTTDSTGSGGTTAECLTWQQDYGLTDVGVFADPYSLLYSSEVEGLPGTFLIDPRTMTIVAVTQGYTGPDPAISQLAQKNAQ